MKRLSIEADVTITIDNKTELLLVADGGQSLTLHVPTVRDAFRLWRNYGGGFDKVLRTLQKLPIPDHQRIIVDIAVDDTVFATLHPNRNPNIIYDALNLPPVSLRPLRLLGLLRR